MAIGPIPLPITGQKIADTFGFLANGPATNLNSYRGLELRDIRTDLVRFLPTNGVIKYSDFENLYLDFGPFPSPDLTLTGPQDLNLTEGQQGTLELLATIDWNLDQWPNSAPLPANYRRRVRWQLSTNNGSTWSDQTFPALQNLNAVNRSFFNVPGQLFRNGWLYRAIVIVETLDSSGGVITSATRTSRTAFIRVSELTLPNPTINFSGTYNNLRLSLLVDGSGSLVNAASGEIRSSTTSIFFFNSVTDNEAPVSRRPISSPLFTWEWWARERSGTTVSPAPPPSPPQLIARGVVNSSGNYVSGDVPGGATSFAGVTTIAGGNVAGGLRGLRFNNIANRTYDNYEFQARVRIDQNASNPSQNIFDTDQANWASLDIDQRVDTGGASFLSATQVSPVVDIITERYQDNSPGPLIRIRTTEGIGKRIRIRVLNEFSPQQGGLTRQFVANFPQFGPTPPGLLRGSFEHTIYSDNDTIGFSGFSSSFFVDPGLLRGLNRLLPTSEPVRIEPVNPSEWANWTGTTINLTIENDVQKAESTRTSPTTIMEGEQVRVSVEASDVLNDGAIFNWAWSGFSIGNGPDDSFPAGTGNFPVSWSGTLTAATSSGGYTGNFTITSNPSPNGLTSGEIEEKDRGSIRVLDQFNNFINQHAVVVNRYVEPPPVLPVLPASRSVSLSGQYRSLQTRMIPDGRAFNRIINPLNTATNTSSQTRWNASATPIDLRPLLVWELLNTEVDIQVFNSGPQTGPFTSPSLWTTYGFVDPAPNGDAFTVGINLPNDINRQSNPNDILARATFTIRVSLSTEPSVSETFSVVHSISAPIRTNPPGGGGAFDGVLD